MNNIDILNKIRTLSNQEKRAITYEQLLYMFNNFNEEELKQLSEIIGYPVLLRLCMNEINHKFLLIQDGAAAIIVNDKRQILLQRRVDNDKWGIPGGCQEIGETFEQTVIREVKEETNLDVKPEDLKLINIISGDIRRREYPNGDVVYNNTVLYLIDKYSGDLKWDEESKVLEFFDMDKLPLNQHDEDLIKTYLKTLR